MLKTILIALCVIVMMPLALCSLSVIGVGVGIVKTVSVVQEGLHQKLEQKGQVTPMPIPISAQAAVGAAWTNEFRLDQRSPLGLAKWPECNLRCSADRYRSSGLVPRL